MATVKVEHGNRVVGGLAMKGGGGDVSYAKNSALQKAIVKDGSYQLISAALDSLRIPTQGPVVIADLGCSSGINTIDHVSFIISTVKDKLSHTAKTLPEFQVFFQDLPGNDFNHLYGLLSQDSRFNSHAMDSAPGRYFKAGIPGSFYERILPKSNVHVFFSSVAMHWLSKVPDAVLDKDSPSYNNGFIWLDRKNPAAVAAYKEQSKRDLKAFLSARAEETVPGGLVIFVYNARNSPDPTMSCVSLNSVCENVWQCLDETATELVTEGVMSEEMRDSFNIPMYFRTQEELEEVLEDFSCVFQVENLQMMESEFKLPEDPVLASQIAKNLGEAVFSVLFKEHFGEDVSRLYWRKYIEVMQTKLPPAAIVTSTAQFAVLKRK